jgi:hypothetical protein
MKDESVPAKKPKNIQVADEILGLDDAQLDQYVAKRVGFWLSKTQEHRLRVQAIIRMREKAMSRGRWTANSAQTSKLIQDEIDMLRETEKTEQEALDFCDSYEKTTGRKIQLPPGHRLIEIARRFLSEGMYKRYIYPHIADMHSEYYPALKAGDLRKAKVIEIAFYFRVLWPIIKAVCSSFKTLIEFASK